MRKDTQELLTRLGQPSFQYREYAGSIEGSPALSWPLFSHVLGSAPVRAFLGGPVAPKEHERAPLTGLPSAAAQQVSDTPPVRSPVAERARRLLKSGVGAAA